MKRAFIRVLLLVIILLSVYGLYFFKTEINSGLVSCGTGSDQGGSVIINLGEDGSSDSCGIYLQKKDELVIGEIFSLVILMVSMGLELVSMQSYFRRRILN